MYAFGNVYGCAYGGGGGCAYGGGGGCAYGGCAYGGGGYDGWGPVVVVNGWRLNWNDLEHCIYLVISSKCSL